MTRWFGTGSCGIAIFLALQPLCANGQNRAADISPQFANVLRTQQHRDAVLATVKQSTTWIRHACETSTFKLLRSLKIWQPVSFDASGIPTGGAWGESVEAEGCGMTRTLNVVTSVRSPGALVSQVLAPGDTKADPVLQRDASRYVHIAFAKRAAGCQQAFLDDTKVVGREPASPDAHLTGPVEVEDWIVSACGEEITVEVKFLPVTGGHTDVVAHVL